MQLRSIARTHRTSGDARAFDLLLGSEDSEVKRVSDAYLSVPASYRRLLAPEA
jgi:hypothetical protein